MSKCVCREVKESNLNLIEAYLLANEDVINKEDLAGFKVNHLLNSVILRCMEENVHFFSTKMQFYHAVVDAVNKAMQNFGSNFPDWGWKSVQPKMVFLSKQMNLFKMFIESKSKESDESVDVDFDVTQLPPLLYRYAQFCEQAMKVEQTKSVSKTKRKRKQSESDQVNHEFLSKNLVRGNSTSSYAPRGDESKYSGMKDVIVDLDEEEEEDAEEEEITEDDDKGKSKGKVNPKQQKKKMTGKQGHSFLDPLKVMSDMSERTYQDGKDRRASFELMAQNKMELGKAELKQKEKSDDTARLTVLTGLVAADSTSDAIKLRAEQEIVNLLSKKY